MLILGEEVPAWNPAHRDAHDDSTTNARMVIQQMSIPGPVNYKRAREAAAWAVERDLAV